MLNQCCWMGRLVRTILALANVAGVWIALASMLATPSARADSLATTGETAYAVRNDGTLWAWGQVYEVFPHVGLCAGYWQCTSDVPLLVAVPVDVTAVVASTYGSSNNGYALRRDGTVWAWGANGWAQLGNGTMAGDSPPAQVPGLWGVIAIAAGSQHALAVTSDGSVWAWGFQAGGGLAGVLVTPQQVSGISGATAVAASSLNSFVLKDGHVWVWGHANLGQYGRGPEPSQPEHWDSYGNTPELVPALDGIVALAEGDSHTLALKSDGTVYAWGLNTHYQAGSHLDPPPGCYSYTRGYINCSSNPTPILFSGPSPVVAIAAGYATSLALRADGTVWGWGLNASGSLGAAVPLGGETATPVQIPGVSNATAIATSGLNSLALTAGGTILAWGNGSTTPAPVPQYNALSTGYPVTPYWPAGSTVTVTNVYSESAELVWPVAAGDVHSYLIIADGSIAATVGANQTRAIAGGLPSDANVTFTVEACDFFQACASSPPVTVHTPPMLHWPDNTQLTIVPTWFTASASWRAAEPAATVSVYHADLWRTDTWEWTYSNSFPASQRSLVVDGLIPDMGYELEISACDPTRCVYLINDFHTLARVPVAIDIRPGKSPNDIDLSSGELLKVAILSSRTFDARTIDASTVTLQGVPAADDDGPRHHDVDHDGRQDLVVRLPIALLAWQLDQNSTSATLEAATTSGRAITGTDSIRIVPRNYTKTPDLDNGDFEQGLKSWFGQGCITTTHTAFSGKRAALVGARKHQEHAECDDDGGQVGPDSFIAQSFQVPADGTVLEFSYQVSCASDLSLGWAAATLVDDSEHSSSQLLEPTCTNDGGWQVAKIRLQAAAGHLVTLRLQNHDAAPAPNGTFTRFDAVKLSPLPPEPVVNGGFETGDISGWTVRPGATASALPLAR